MQRLQSYPTAGTESGRMKSRFHHGTLIKSARKRIQSGDWLGLQNRRVAGNPVTDGFDPHSLPPFFSIWLTNDQSPSNSDSETALPVAM